MKQIVIYKSRTGFTKKYAKWLAQSLNCECIPQEDVGGERLSDYDVIIFGSSFRAGNVEELKWYKETILPFEKTNVLFVTGAMPPSSADAVKSLTIWQMRRTLLFTQESSIIAYKHLGLNLL